VILIKEESDIDNVLLLAPQVSISIQSFILFTTFDLIRNVRKKIPFVNNNKHNQGACQLIFIIYLLSHSQILISSHV